MKLDSNFQKGDTARYTYEKHLLYVRHYAPRLLFSPTGEAESTKGLGMLANQAQHRARGLIRALKASAKATGNKLNVPEITRIGCPARLRKSKRKTRFDFWLSVENAFTNRERVEMPCNSHKALNEKLKTGWVLAENAEFFYDHRGCAFALVFVQKEVAKAEPRPRTLGCDVGYRNGVIRSDGYVGRNTSKVLRAQGEKRSERQRQGHRKTSVKTQLKQILDREARRALGRSKLLDASLVVESPKVLANLRSGKLHGWARTYFANRCQVLGQEFGVFVWGVNPAYTSMTCHACGNIDKRSRLGIRFKCVGCGHSAHADINAAKNIAAKGAVSLGKLVPKRSGAV